MMRESLGNTGPEETPRKSDRLKTIIAILEEAKPAATAEEANMLVRKTFAESEDASGVETSRMNVHALDSCYRMTYKGKKIYYQIYHKHVLFIADNGAIDIRKTDGGISVVARLIEQHPSFPEEQLDIEFEKKGADGRGVWEE